MTGAVFQNRSLSLDHLVFFRPMVERLYDKFLRNVMILLMYKKNCILQTFSIDSVLLNQDYTAHKYSLYIYLSLKAKMACANYKIAVSLLRVTKGCLFMHSLKSIHI